MAANTYEIREYRPGDEHGILATFDAVFAANDPRFVGRDLARWRWAYEQNPAGRQVIVATTLVDGAEQIVAHYAALPVRVILEGREALFAQGVDSMTHPAHRAGLKRPGLFVNTAEVYFERFAAADRTVVVYGLPIEQAYRMGARFLDYEIVRTQTFLGLETHAARAEFPREVERLERFDEQARWLFDRCAGAFGAVALRDAAYLSWRFSRPGAQYTALGVRDGAGILRGLCVLRRVRLADLDVVAVCEWLVPPEEPEVGVLLERAARAVAAAEGAPALACVVPDWSPWFAWFQDAGWRVFPSPYLTCTRHFARRYDPLWSRNNWWYTLADTDLV
jgi:hypothetical protein